MRRRLYFLLPDLGSAIKTANDLLLARVEDSHMHFLAKRGMSLLTPPDGVTLQLVTVLISTVIGAVFGAWASSLVAMSVPNTRLKPFQKAIDAGKILLMVDLPTSRIEEVQELVHRRHPEASAHGIEPTMPAFP